MQSSKKKCILWGMHTLTKSDMPTWMFIRVLYVFPFLIVLREPAFSFLVRHIGHSSSVSDTQTTSWRSTLNVRRKKFLTSCTEVIRTRLILIHWINNSQDHSTSVQITGRHCWLKHDFCSKVRVVQIIRRMHMFSQEKLYQATVQESVLPYRIYGV